MPRTSRSVPLKRSPAFFDGVPPRVLAHRGLAIDAPENTALAFLKALSIGATHLETDVHASSDGIAVISHDEDLRRVAGRTNRIDELTFAELAKVDLGAGQTYSSLAGVLDAFPQARFNIDVKAEAAIAPTIDAIAAAGATDRVLITSFSDSRRTETVRGLPGVATSASVRSVALALLFSSIALAPLARRVLRHVQAVQIPERFRGIRVVTPRLIRTVHAAGIEVHVWTVNDPADMARLLDLGVDGLVTDRADLALALVAERSRNRT